MKPKLLVCLMLVLICALVGCATQRDDARLQGTWTLNRNATAVATSNAPPSGMEVTYSHGAMIVRGDKAHYGYWAVSFHYHVVEQGSNYIVIRTTAPMDNGQDIRIRFVDSDMGYWIDAGQLGFGIPERFDKFQPKTAPQQSLDGMGGIIPPPVIPLDL